MALAEPARPYRRSAGMPLWKISPAASPDDDRWQGRPIWSELIVEAPTAASARVLASEWALSDQPTHIGNETPSPRSGFEDEKLYWVRRLRPSEALQLTLPSDRKTPVRRASRLA